MTTPLVPTRRDITQSTNAEGSVSSRVYVTHWNQTILLEQPFSSACSEEEAGHKTLFTGGKTQFNRNP